MVETRSPYTVKAANASITKHRVGRQWVVVWWDDTRQVWRETHGMNYSNAIQFIRNHKAEVTSGQRKGYLP